MADMIANLEKMLAQGGDSASLRFALASKYFEQGELTRAAEHAELAVELDADYSAAWRLLGRIQSEAGETDRAKRTFEHGIEVAEKRGDRQVAREMQVFLKRLERAQ